MDSPYGHTRVSLLQRVQSDSTNENWREFLEVYQPFIDRFLRAQGVLPQDVEDIRQEVFAMLLRELPAFQHNGQVGAFRKWLRSLTAHRLRTFRRKTWNTPATGDSVYESLAAGLADDESELSRLFEVEHDRSVLQHLVSQLRDKQSVSIFRRADLEQQPVEAVAQEFGVSVNAVAVARSHVRKELRALAQGLVDL